MLKVLNKNIGDAPQDIAVGKDWIEQQQHRMNPKYQQMGLHENKDCTEQQKSAPVQTDSPQKGRKSLPFIYKTKANVQNYKELEELNTKELKLLIKKWLNELDIKFSKRNMNGQ